MSIKTYPLTQSQLGVFLEWSADPSMIRYNLPFVAKFGRNVDAEKLKKAFQTLVEERPILRNVFIIDENGEPRQYSDPSLSLEVPIREMGEQELEDYIENGFVRPFSPLGRELLVRVEIVLTDKNTVLLADFHHSIIDGATCSPNITQTDLPDLYDGKHLEKEVYSIYEYAEDEQDELASQQYADAKEYYREKLSNVDFADFGNATLNPWGNNIRCSSFVDADRVDEWCAANGTQVNLLFMAAFSYVMSLMCREEKIAYYSINHGRTDRKLRTAYGMFVKSVPIVTTINGNSKVLDFIKSLRSELFSTIRNGAYPFNHLCRDLHKTPTVEFGFQGLKMQEIIPLSDGVGEVRQLTQGKTKSNMSCIIYYSDGQYEIRLRSSDAINSGESLETVSRALKAVVENMMADPEAALSTVSLMGEEERKRVEAMHSTAITDVPVKLFHEPIERNAIRIPDRVALVAKDKTLTFKELNEEANRISHGLMERGVKKGDRVVLLLPRRSYVICSMFAVTKAGAAYIPCDPQYPAERINLIQTDSGAQFVITTKEHLKDYPEGKAIDIEELLKGTDTGNPNVDVTGEDLAYLIYTSGSTGRPKGVMLRHKGIANYLYDHPANVHIHGLTELDVKSFVSITTLSFDMSLKEFAGSLFNGITSIFADEDEVMDASLLAALMKRTHAEGINGTCSRLLSYLESPEFCDAIRNCKVVWSGGEVYPKQLLTSLQALGVHIFNTYGPTEITVSSNIKDLTKSESVTVGKPLLNYVEYVVDRYNNELPVGIVGELLIGGPGVALGYNNLEEMTAQRFVQYKGERVYRSGDLARWTPDGDVEILGRTDNQIKLRGFRIELGEVEGKAAGYKGIRQAVADVKNIGAVQHLCLYYTADEEIDKDALSAWLAESLTEYMVPTAYMQVDSIPLSPNGKADRKRLPAPSLGLQDIVAPENEMEQQLFNIVADVLQLSDFGVTNNLVSLGLSSLSSMKLSARIKKELGVSILMKEIMDNPSVRQLAELAADDAHKDTCKVKLEPHPAQKYYPMTDSQRSMYIDCAINPDTLIYNIPCVVHFKDVDADRVEKAIREVFEAHPYLKVRLEAKDDDIVQVRDDSAPVAVSRERLADRPDRAALQKYIKPFDLLHEPLYRLNLLEFMDEVYLVADIHHVVGDGSSNHVIARELERVLSGEDLTKEVYTAYDRALDEDELIKSDRSKEAADYFESLIAGVDNTVYPHSSQPDNQPMQGVVETEIDAEAVNLFCKQHGVTASNFFLEVFHQVLHRITRDEMTMIYFISNGRSELMLDNFVGVLVKTLPTTEKNFSGKMSEMVEAMTRQIGSTIKNDFYPFTRLVEDYGIRAEIIYNYVYDLETNVRFAGQEMETYTLDWDVAKTPLSITVDKASDGNYLSVLEYDRSLYSERDMTALNEAFKVFALNCIRPEYHDISLVPMLQRSEAQRVISLSRGKTFDVDCNETFPAMFMKAAAEHPSSDAVVDEKGSYTYKQLNELSGALARAIKSRTDSQFISIMLGCQKEFLVASIGIEKAGKAYVPLDYDYPDDRLLYMLEDSESGLLITSHEVMEEKKFEFENVLYIDDFLSENQGEEADESFNLATPDSIAYMIYTSGSTGKPKGVMIPHRAKSNFVRFIAAEWGHKPESRICCHSSFSFDASIEDLYPVLTVGGAMYVVPSEARKDLKMLHEFIVSNHITGGCYTTQLGQMLLQMYPDLPVDYLVVGGEKMTATPDCKCRLINTYGPTEFTVDSTYYVTEPGKEYSNIPIGRPLYNLGAFVVDTAGQLLPMGMAGELCMSGVQSAAGYWKREELTSQKFVPSPFCNGETMYHTGDLVRYNAEGQIEYIGRIDNQVKLRGFRIEMGEIESVLSTFGGITSAVAEVKTVNGIQHLVAYYVSDAPITEAFLKSELAKSLTDYMIPDAFIRMESLPLTPNGKVDRKALPLPELKADEIVAPETEQERQLFAVVSEELGTDQFGVTTNLLSMGLTSIRAIRLSMAIKNRLGLNISTGDILSSARIRDWKESESEAIKVSEPREYYPLTDNQLGVYIDWEQHRDSLQYNVLSALRLTGVDAEKLVSAIKDIISNHPSLKTRIVQIEGVVMQHRRDDSELNVLFGQLENEPSAEFFQSRVHPFNLLEDDLARFEVYSTPTSTYLFFDIHHIIFDGGAANVLLSDLSKILSGSRIESEKVSAFDYALYYDEWKRSDKYVEYERYFDGLVSDTESFLYPVSSKVHSSEGKSATLTVSVQLEKIRSFCRDLGITENAYFATALTQVFHRISREKAIQIATISNGRSMNQLSETMGMFVQTLPLVSRRSKGNTADILRDMQSQIVETVRRDKYPFTCLSERHGIRPNVLYAYQGDVIDEGALSGLEKVENIHLSLDTVKAPVILNVFPSGGYYSIVIEYDEGMYSESDMKLLGDALSVFATTIAETSPNEDISAVGLTAPSEVADLIALGTGEVLEYDSAETFIDQFLRSVRQYPDSVAVVDATSSITYRELDEKSDVLASHLIESGIHKDSFVSIMLPRVKEFLVAVLGVWKAGGAYLPLGSEYPKERLRFMLEDAETEIMLTESSIWNKMSDVGLPAKTVIKLDEFDFGAPASPVNKSDADGLAYMIYTSGSTGRPKGTMLEHRNLRSFNQWLVKLTEMKSGDAITEHASFSFDGSCLDLYPALTVGGQVHILNDDLRRDIPALVDYFKAHQIKGCFLTTRLAQELLNNFDLPLDYMMMGGEKNYGFRPSKVKVYEVYGPTETTILATWGLTDQTFPDIDNIPIGRPAPNLAMFIVDGNRQLVPRGMSGELCIAGPQVARGYWKQPELTAEKFISAPFADGIRMYRTGDLCRWDEEGNILFLGRIDNQVKLRGFRIEMGEVDSALSKYPGIKEAVSHIVVVNGTQHLCAWYVSETEIDESSLRSSLSETLTDYMVPTAFVRMDSLPLNPNGKIDKKALPEPRLEEDIYVAPSTEAQNRLSEIVCELLKIDRVSVESNLISLGLSSLSAMKLGAQIKQRLDVLVSTKEIMSSPRIVDIAAYIDGSSAAGVEDTDKVYERREEYPLTENQRGVYIDWEMNRSALQYNIPDVIRLDGVQPEVLKNAVIEVVNAHPSLKTVLRMSGEDVVQVRRDEEPVVVTVTQLDEEPDAAFFQRRVQPFNLFRDTLYRIEIYRTPSTVYLFKDIHHIIFDGGSDIVFMNDLKKAISGEKVQAETFTAFDRALYEKEFMAGDGFKAAEKYFDELLAETQTAVYPHSDHPEGGDNRSARVTGYVEAAGVDAYCRRHAFTRNSYFMTVLMQVLHLITRENDIAVATIDNGRSTVAMQGITGMFVKTIPVVSKADSAGNFTEAVSQMQKQFNANVSNSLYPYTKIVERFHLAPEIMFGYQGGLSEFGSDEAFELTLDTAKAPLCIFFTPDTEGRYRVDAEYSQSIYNAGDVEQLVKAIVNFAVQAAAETARPSLVSEEEKEALISLSCGPQLDYDKTETFPSMFLRNAALRPDAIAVVDKAGVLTYSELAAQSARYATYLINAGVREGDFVGIMLPRCKEFLSAVVAVQRIGAAYIPIDPEYPEDRINYMTEDCNAAAVITPEMLAEMDASKASDIDLSKPDALAYMIYTSGSTGRPKGVMLPHRALRAFLAWRVHDLEITPESRHAQHASFSFDASLDDLLSPLAAGGSVYIMPEEIRKDMDAINEFICSNKITGLTLSTQLGMVMVNGFDLPVKFIMMGGEKMLPMRKVPFQIINGYGPTEFTVCSSYHIVDQDKDTEIPIGRPVPNTLSLICDRYGHLLPKGMIGELCLAGPQIAEGYWHRPELTEERFIASPVEGMKMYRTGDLARYNEEGLLEFFGRIDSQVKLRGFRIEMGEIETQAKLYEGVTSVAAEVREVNGSRHLCLYFTADGKISPEDFEAFLSTRLTSYMVPEAFIQLDAMPLTPNGKVDRKALPVPQLKAGTEYVEPADGTEKTIAEAFASVLGITEPVGALDSFFSLGGDSIKSIRLVSILRSKGITLQVSDIMKYKTVRSLSEVAVCDTEVQIDQKPWSGEMKNSPIVDYFFSLNLPKAHHFNQSFLLQADGRVDKAALGKAMDALTGQHDSLRAVLREGHLYVREYAAGWPIEELSLNSVAEAESECNKRQAGINMAESLFNVTLIHMPEYDLLLMVCHHLVVDAVSWRILLEDLQTAYGQAVAGNEVSLPAKTHTYNDYVEAIGRYRESQELKLQIPYWMSVVERMSELELSEACKPVRTNTSVTVRMDAVWTAHLLKDASGKSGLEINDLLTASLGRSYRSLTGKNALSLQFEGHGREKIDSALQTDRTVGWFTSVFPVVLDNMSGDMLKDIRNAKETMHRIPSKGVGFNILRFASEPEIDGNLVPLVGFNYLGVFDSAGNGQNSSFSLSKEVHLGPDFAQENQFGPAVSINCSVNDGEFVMNLVADNDVFTPEETQKLADGFIEELKDVTAYIMEHDGIGATASDYGEYVWTDEEFEYVRAMYDKAGMKIERIYPLSYMQEGIMLHLIMHPDSLAYRLVSTYSLDILPAYEQLRYALDRLGDKHEVLRTALVYKNVSEYRQVILDRPLGLEMRDLSRETNIDSAVRQIHLSEEERGFDMQMDPLFRIICLKTSAKSCRLILSVHHIIVDGWCIGLFTNDLMRYLLEAMEGRTSEPDRSNDGRYEAYIRELRQKDMDRGFAYWSTLLSGYNTTAVIPSDGIVPENEQSEDDRVSFTFTGDIPTALQNLCSSEQVTINSVVELAWGLTLHTYNHNNDSVFVKVVSGRNNSSQSVENIVGLFINSVPVRVTTEPGQTIRQSLAALQKQASETNTWDFCPLAEIQNRSELGQNLFQSIVAFENYSEGERNDFPFAVRSEYSKEESFNDITITAYASEGSLTVNMAFDKTKYRMEEMERTMGVLRHIIKTIAFCPDMETQRISALGIKQTMEMLELGKGITMPFDHGETLVSLFRRQAGKTPDAPCVVFEEKSMTFREVDELTDRLALHLHRKYSVTVESIVGVMIERSELMVIYPMAIMKAGAAYMPLDFHFPTERLSFMCSDAGVKLILSEENRVAEALPEFSGDVFLSDALATLPAVDEAAVKAIPQAAPENVFVVLYTSGSTGTPKGVLLEQHNIVNFCHWYIDTFNVTGEDRAVAYANFGFDAHMMDIYPAITAGASVYIISNPMRMDLMAMNAYMERHNLSIAFMTTQVGYMFATTIENHSLRLLSVGGEKLQPLSKPRFRFYNGYGPTECTLYSTCYNIESDYNSGLIGRPLANYQLFVVDQNFHLVPRGAAGELIVAGEGVGRGYLNRPDINADKFITLKIEVGKETRTYKAYRTGDLVRWSRSGDIDFLGRIDNQVKLRGLRIELGEIEARVTQYPGIKSSAVDVKEIAGAQHICCYFLSDTLVSTDSLRDFIAEKLADYMIPTAYVQMESFPLTPNGKVNRRALPVPQMTVQTENVKPDTPKEEILFSVAKELLGHDNFGVTDDLIKCGLTSLLAIKMVVMAEKRGVQIKLNDLMKARTIRQALKDKICTCGWLNGYTPNKPVAVVVCGATPYKDMSAYCDALGRSHSVLIFEPLVEHYDLIFMDADVDEVVDMYYSLLDAFLEETTTPVSVFTGHCFGGELAYRLAVKYLQDTGVAPLMVMLDVFWRVEKNENSMAAMTSLIPDEVYQEHKGAIDSYVKAMSMYDSLARQGEPELYDGRIVLFRALQEEPMSDEMKAIFNEGDPRLKMLWDLNTSDRKMDNEAFWRRYYPEMEVYGVDAHHISMLTEEFAGQYAEWIESKESER